MSKALIGIDIGSDSTKILEAVLSRGILEIVNLGQFKTPYKGIEIDEEVFFKQLYKQVPLPLLKNSDFSFSVPSSAVNFSVLELPKMPQADLKQVILREGRRKISPPPSENDIFDSIVMEEKGGKGGNQTVKIFVGCGSRQIIEERVSLFRGQGVLPKFIGSAPFVLTRYASEYLPSIKGNLAFIDIGFKNTNLIIFNSQKIILARTIPFASFHFIDSLAKKKAIRFQEAEELFLKNPADTILTLDSLEYLLSEMRRSFAYSKELDSAGRIDVIYFSGGLLKNAEIFNLLKSKVGGKVEAFAFQPIKQAEKFKTEEFILEGPAFATALGLTLALKPSRKAILNFLPPEIPRAKRAEVLKLIWIQVLIWVVLGILFLLGSILSRIGWVVLQTDRLSKDFSEEEYRYFTKKANEINLRMSNFRKQKDLREEALRSCSVWDEMLLTLTKVLPPEVFIREISADYKSGVMNLKIKSAVFKDYEGAVLARDNFYKGLMDSKLFSEVKLAPVDSEALFKLQEREISLEARINLK